jgi:AcrR family transcriptional regulator
VARTADPHTQPALRDAAADLFYSRGIAATALDDVAAASGLTKPTLYRHFPSKEALLLAYLDDRHERLDAELRAWIEAAPPRERPRAVIDWLCESISRPDYNGCAFVRAQAEVPHVEAIRARARTWKLVLLEAIREACRAARAPDPDALARELVLIVEGATTMAFVSGEAGSVAEANRRLAEAALAGAGLGQA